MKPQAASSHIELDPLELKRNIDFVRNQLNKGVKLSAVVKGNAYGHGLEQIVPMMEREGIDHFSVYGIQEARDFSKYASKGSELMIMGYITPESIDWVLKNEYEFFVYDIAQLQRAANSAAQLNLKARVHIELETGMNRTGIIEDDLKEVVTILSENKDHLEISGVCTHLAGAESLSNYYRIKKQINNFRKHLKFFDSQGITFKRRHVACSAGLMRYPQVQFDLVRVGILLYGFWPSRETLIDYLTKNNAVEDPLTSIISWKTHVMTLQPVKAGEYIGYGTSFLANRPMKIAILPVGYAHGYSRMLSNQGRVLIHGHRVAVVGKVNMNMMAVDVTEIANVKIGDEAVLIGFQGENRITVAAFGEMSSQLNYELLARLPHNIPRIIKN